MPKIHVSTLAGQALDWAVMKCEFPENTLEFFLLQRQPNRGGHFRYSSCMGQGGQIIEREQITTTPGRRGPQWDGWTAWARGREDTEFEDDRLLPAGLRCFVWMRLGALIDVPQQLLTS